MYHPGDIWHPNDVYHPDDTPHSITILHPTDSYLFLQPELTVECSPSMPLSYPIHAFLCPSHAPIMPHACPFHAPFMSFLCSVHAHFMPLLCTFRVPFIPLPCPFHAFLMPVSVGWCSIEAQDAVVTVDLFPCRWIDHMSGRHHNRTRRTCLAHGAKGKRHLVIPKKCRKWLHAEH